MRRRLSRRRGCPPKGCQPKSCRRRSVLSVDPYRRRPPRQCRATVRQPFMYSAQVVAISPSGVVLVEVLQLQDFEKRAQPRRHRAAFQGLARPAQDVGVVWRGNSDDRHDGVEKEVVGESPGLAGGCGLRANASHPVGATAIESPSNGDAKASQSSQRLPAKRLPAEKLSATKRPFCRPLPAAAASANVVQHVPVPECPDWRCQI